MKALLRRLIAGLGFSRRGIVDVRRFDRSGSLTGMNDAQLRDIGLWRADEQTYLRLREPAVLDILFPGTGGTRVGEDGNTRSGPMKPQLGVKSQTLAD
ncbi:MAG TPA: hypothetical protein VGV39_12195 [Mesorhizobium sp.]|uniref:hypothetical protein n=1 Tax=Mesorhizobium sp. TaxID=1871066 RepID=UPI002DDD0207|nr:hypothetical protein [Mesorhizobium sp.]HEV2503829.1 hypothetical protein [Mesorhizobium sp.]